MNVPRFAPLSAALLMLGLTSCPETNVPRDFGVKPAVLKPEAWEGDWSEVENPEEKVHFAIKQADQGVLSITLHDKEKKTDSVIEAVVRHASEDKGTSFSFHKKQRDAVSLNCLPFPIQVKKWFRKAGRSF